VKNLKIFILLFAVLGLIALFMNHWTDLFKVDKVQGLLLLAGFLVPAIMAGMAMSKPPLQKWQAGLALAGFALIFIKSRMWDILPHIADVITVPRALLPIIAVIGGLIVSIIALVKSEEA
jgi:hypothetical protein